MRKSKPAFKKALVLASALIMLFSMTACGSEVKFMEEKDMVAVTTNPTGTIDFTFTYTENGRVLDYIVTMDFVLYYDKAPITVSNFIYLVKSGFYAQPTADKGGFVVDAISDAYASMGLKRFEMTDHDDDDDTDKVDTLTSVNPAYNIIGEFTKNGWLKSDNTAKNDIKFERGTMFMLRSVSGDTGYNTAYSQFAIADSIPTNDKTYAGYYAAFGKVTKVTTTIVGDSTYNDGVEAAFDNMVKVSKADRENYVTINKITINTYDVDFTKDFVKKWTIKV